MKIKTWIKYEESYLPPRCRKLRYKECEDYINANLAEASIDNVSLAFEDNSYAGKGKIYYFKNKLWSKVEKNSLIAGDTEKYKDALEILKYLNEHYSWYFPRLWRDGEHPDRKHMLSVVRKEMQKYLLIDGVLYKQTAEPRYVIVTFGLGHNHGGTGMLCEYHYNDNIGKQNYFSALQGNEAVAYANYVAKRRGDTNNVGKFEPFIICHMPELVKIKPNKQHGDGNKFLNDMEDMICNTDNIMEAGLLAMCMCNKE